jgi:predicted dehydrogenase
MSQTSTDTSSQDTPSVSRRDFIATSAAAGGLALGAPSIIKAQSSSDEINVGLIGFGQQGQVQVEAAINIPNVKFRALCDIWPYAQKKGIGTLLRYGHDVRDHYYEDYREMLEKEKGLDAVLIASPDFMHSPMTVDALSAGKHVYCEKLMSNTVEGARAMVKASQDSGNLLQIGHQRRSNPRYLHAKEKLVNGKDQGGAGIFGRITHANGQWNRAVSEARTIRDRYNLDEATLNKYGFKNMHQFLNWRWFKNLGGGPISDLGAHQIDIFNWFLDAKPTSVMASGGVDYYDNYEWHDNVMTIYEFDTPKGTARAFYQVLTTTSAGGGFFEYFMGDEGCMKISEIPRLTKIYREARAPEWDGWIEREILKQSASAKKAASEEVKVDVRESAALVEYLLPVELKKKIHQPHLENFFEAVSMFGGDKAKAKAHLNCPGETAFQTAVTVLKVNKAVAAQQTLKFEESEFKI